SNDLSHLHWRVAPGTIPGKVFCVMKPCLCSAILIGCCFSASAETNSATLLSFALPAAQLRSVSSEEATQVKSAAEPQPERTLQLLDTSRRTNLLQIASAEFEPA